MKVLIVLKIILVITIEHVWWTVWRIYMLILGSKALMNEFAWLSSIN